MAAQGTAPSSSSLRIASAPGLPPGSRVPNEPSVHGGEETIVCLRGEVVCVQADQEYVLGARDAISWDASKPHWVENRRRQVSEIIAVITPPNF